MIRTFAFTNASHLQGRDFALAQVPGFLADPTVFVWLDLEKPTAEDTRLVLEQLFHFHPLSIEDCVMVNSSPKVEEYIPREGDAFAPYLFLVMHAVDYSRANEQFATSELNFFLGKKFLVTYHDVPLRSITTAVERITKGTMPVTRAPDRLAQTLLDLLVANYTPALDELAQDVDGLEQLALRQPTPATLNQILQVKKEVLHLRQITGPQCAVIARFAAGEFSLIRPHLVPYYRNLHDACQRINDQAHGYTDALTGILQVYLNMSSNQTGEVVKVLTLITVITTPLMMIGTWYGMNFKDMPEVTWAHGYIYAATAMLVSTGATYLYFKKRKWF